jgi:DNA-binding IclR family transcriptional regulator
MHSDLAEGQRVELNSILRILEDQHPHSVSGIAKSVNMPAEKVESIFRFLAKYSFITYDKKRNTVNIRPDFLSLSGENE